jgi:hypothetical protein
MDHTSDALRALVLTYYRLSVRNDLYSYFSMLLICGGRGIIPAQTRGRAHLRCRARWRDMPRGRQTIRKNGSLTAFNIALYLRTGRSKPAR